MGPWSLFCNQAQYLTPGIILGMDAANERRCSNAMLFLIGCAHTQNDLCFPYPSVYMGQYQIVVHFGYGSTMKYFVNICVFSLI